MRRTQLLFAIGMCLLSAPAARSQASDAVVLSEALRAHLRGERFDTVTSIRGLPLGIRDALERLFGNGLDIADPGADFQMTRGVANSKLPTRRLVAAECSRDHCLVYYERGGVDPTWHVALFRWTPAETRLEGGGTAPGRLATITDVWNAILSGGIRGQSKVW
jgi:hypothetical protein